MIIIMYIHVCKCVSTRLKAAKVTDQRVKVMNEVISGIRVIKMYGWELAFHKMVTAIRK